MRKLLTLGLSLTALSASTALAEGRPIAGTSWVYYDIGSSIFAASPKGTNGSTTFVSCADGAVKVTVFANASKYPTRPGNSVMGIFGDESSDTKNNYITQGQLFTSESGAESVYIMNRESSRAFVSMALKRDKLYFYTRENGELFVVAETVNFARVYAELPCN